MEKHTPGPWEIYKPWTTDEATGKGIPHPYKWWIKPESNKNGYVLAEVGDLYCAKNDDLNGQNKANAALIAAAPDLLEALKLLRDEIHALRLLDVKKHYSLCVADAAAGKAIHKTEGREP